MVNKITREVTFDFPSSSISKSNHDVFLSSFSEDPSNKIIIDGIYDALVQRGIHALRGDNDEHKQLRGGEKALIEESRIAIVLFSRKYVSSMWCLDELVKLVECRSNGIGLTVLPVFCDVDPSDVRKQTGSLEEAFARYGEHFKDEEKEKVESWRAALTTVANLSGWDLHNVSNGQEAKFIQIIVDEVLIKLSRKPLKITRYLIGIESRVASMNHCINRPPHIVRIIGICGISGLGKTTIAKAIYNEIYHTFEGCCFLENVKEVSKQPNGLIQLQEQLLCDVLLKKNLKINNISKGINVIKQRLHCKRVLIVIDDVDHLDQLNALAIKRDSFGIGSKIIVISQDEHLLNEAQDYDIYHPEELDFNESLQLFSWHAFKNDSPPNEYEELSKEIVNYVKGLPFALEIMGSLMFGKRSLSEWEHALVKLESKPDDQIQKALRLSFYDLDDIEKDIFLDIACFFIGMEKNYVCEILDGCNLFPVIGIRILSQRSLIKIDEMNRLRMHDLLRDMAKEIVQEESPEEPGRHTRLWSREDVCDVLVKHEGTKSVEGIILDNSQFEDVCFSTEAFVDMPNLRLLQLNYVHLRGEYEYLSKKLRWLRWYGFPLNSIPRNFDLENLIVLDMKDSSIKEVWKEIKLLKRLKILNLSHSSCLMKTPNFSGLPNLEELILVDCKSLVEVHQSIGCLNKLVVLDLKNCNNLMKLPDSIGLVSSLKVLNLSGCSKQVQSTTSWFSSLRRQSTCSTTLLPTSFSGLCSLESVNLNYCNLSEDLIPNDFWRLPLLTELRLDGNRLCTLPSGIKNLSRLSWLTLRNCKDLKLMTELPLSLDSLNLEGCSTMEMLASNISDLPKLSYLNLKGCKKLQSFPKLPSCLFQLQASSCKSLQRGEVKELQNLRELVIDYDDFCSKSDEISCLGKLERLILEGCERPQTLPKLPPTLDCLFVEGDISTLLANCGDEIQSSMETSQSVVQDIYMEGCHHLGNTLRKNNSLFQDINRFFEVWGRGSEIPKWMSHQNMGSSVSFEVSAECWGCKIQGLDVSAVFSSGKDTVEFRSIAVICNKTKDIQWGPHEGIWQSIATRRLGQDEDVLWVRHISIPELWYFSGREFGFGDHFEVGDQVQVLVEIEGNYPGGSLQVIKCGVLLVHMPYEEEEEEEEEEIPSYDVSMVECMCSICN